MKSIKLLGVLLTFFVFFGALSAQTLQEVVEARNSGTILMASGDIDGAIAEFERCIELAKQVGEDAEEHQFMVEAALPGLYLRKVQNIPRTDQQAMLQALITAVEVAEKYNDARTKESAERQIPQIYYALGAAAYSAQNTEEAFRLLDEAIARDPNIAGAYFIKGVIYETLRDEANMHENYMLAIEKGRAVNMLDNSQRAQSAQQRLRNFHYNAGIPALRAPQRWDDAIASFSKAIEADENYFEAWHGLAMAYNGARRWDEAIEASQKALEIREDPNIFWELGEAYKGKNDTARACENYRRVTSGPRLENARHEITVVLRCN